MQTSRTSARRGGRRTSSSRGRGDSSDRNINVSLAGHQDAEPSLSLAPNEEADGVEEDGAVPNDAGAVPHNVTALTPPTRTVCV